MRIREHLSLAVVLLLSLVLLPTMAYAEESSGFDWDTAPLGEANDQDEPLEASTAITRIKITGTNSMLVPGVKPTYSGAIDKSDPNYDHLQFNSECWFLNYSESTLYPGSHYPPPLKGEKYQYYVAITAEPGYTISNNLTVNFHGKDYKATVRGGGGSPYIITWGYRITVDNAVPLYRMYNTKTSEHLWTRNKKEYDSCGSGNYKDWRAEGIAWYAPYDSARPVFRLYNLKSGDHHYTTNEGERDKLVASGQWRDEGVAFFSARKSDDGVIAIYRVYNSKLKRGQHHYTKSAAERDSLVKNSGWKDEGVGFYGFKSEMFPGSNQDVL